MRPDGYHELESIFHGVGLADEIEVAATSSGKVEVEMVLEEGLGGRLPEASENLVSEAAAVLLEHGATNPGVAIKVLKRIPIAAGLGGGSGNAAGVLVALNELWGVGLDKRALLDAGAQVGSDVPYCFGGGTALAMRRGEALTPLPAPLTMWFVLGVSFEPLLTKEIYGVWDTIGRSDDAGSAPMALALGAGDAGEVASLLHNDLERAAFRARPELEGKKLALLEAGALGAAVTGSGPTLYAVAESEQHAHSIADRVRGLFDRVLIVSSHPRCVELLD